MNSFGRFIIVGILTNAVYFGMLAILQLIIGVPLWVGSATAYAISMISNYIGHHYFTFDSGSSLTQTGTRYLIVQSAGLLLNSFTLEFLVTYAGYPYFQVQIFALTLITILNFLAQRLWVFSPGKLEQPPVNE